MAGVLLGIARHARPKAPMELLDHAAVTCAGGIAGDWRGAMKGRPYRRQVTLLARAGWDAALRGIGHGPGRTIGWQERRANLLVDGLELPRRAGAIVRIGAEVMLEVTRETDPCDRMEAVAPGLRAALAPDWRGGACAMVVRGGRIAPGDGIRIEESWPSLSER